MELNIPQSNCNQLCKDISTKLNSIRRVRVMFLEKLTLRCTNADNQTSIVIKFIVKTRLNTNGDCHCCTLMHATFAMQMAKPLYIVANATNETLLLTQCLFELLLIYSNNHLPPL